MDDLLTKIMEAGFQGAGYGEDHMIAVRGPILEYLIDVMQEVPKLILQWCDRTGRLVNPGKVMDMVCTRSYKWNRKCQLKMRRQE